MKRRHLDLVCRNLPHTSLEAILLHYIHLASQDISEYLNETGLHILQTRGFSTNNLTRWAWIICGDGPDDMMKRFLTNSCHHPHFLFLQILHLDFLEVQTLKAASIYVWDKLLSPTWKGVVGLSDIEIDSEISSSEILGTFKSTENSFQAEQLSDLGYESVIGRLLRQAQRIWPEAMPSIAQMFGSYVYGSLAAKSSDPVQLDLRTHRRFSKQANAIIRRLALPASIEPLKSMVHNWNAQKVILELGKTFEPPLSLDERSYRAVAQVLAASKKSDRESKAATFRSRSWPPWREAQDGMDAQNSAEESLSRVVIALARKEDSGFKVTNSQEKALRILGGQEADGTPTIHTRRLFKMRSRRSNSVTSQMESDAPEWAARIEATRDIREAWGAFMAYKDQGRKPTLSMYFAMFVKINYEKARIEGKHRSATGPGDGKEVFPVPDDNISNFYKSRLQPPSLDELYRQMIESGIRPSGQCLLFLIEHARHTSRGLHYLRDSKTLNEPAMACLVGGHDVPQRQMILEEIPIPIFAAVITLFCRFAPRFVVNRQPSSLPKWGRAPEEQLRSIEERRSLRLVDPLPHAAELLNLRKPAFRPAWYALFRALTRRNAVVVRNLAGDPKNDILAWRVLAAALRDFRDCKLELDSRGFQIICNGFVKAVEALDHTKDDNNEVLGSLPMLKAEFRRLSGSGKSRHYLPTLSYSIHGSHLHAYVRVLGFTQDYEEMISVLRWMVDNHEALNANAQQSRNGPKLLRRVIVAIKVFCDNTDYEAEAQKLVNAVEMWDGWPGDFEAQRYLERWSGLETESQDDQE